MKEIIKNANDEVIGGVGEDNKVNKSKISEGKIQDYKDRYGKVYKIDVTIEPDDDTTLEYEFVFKKPQQASFDRYMRTMNSSPMKAARTFISDNIIPELESVLNDVTKEYPAIIITINEKLLFSLGLGKESNIKKL